MYNKTMGCLEGLAHGFETINHVHDFKTMCTWFAHGFYAHGFKTMHMVYGFKTMCKAFYTTHRFIVHGLGGPCTWFRRALQMVLRPCARPPKQPIVLLYML